MVDDPSLDPTGMGPRNNSEGPEGPHHYGHQGPLPPQISPMGQLRNSTPEPRPIRRHAIDLEIVYSNIGAIICAITYTGQKNTCALSLDTIKLVLSNN